MNEQLYVVMIDRIKMAESKVADLKAVKEANPTHTHVDAWIAQAEREVAAWSNPGVDKDQIHTGGRGNGARGGLYGAKQVNRIIGRYPKGVARAVPVVIGKYEQQEMADQEQLLWLQALEDAGVDNWSGFAHAYDTLEELKNG